MPNTVWPLKRLLVSLVLIVSSLALFAPQPSQAIIDDEPPSVPGTPATASPTADNTPTWDWTPSTDNLAVSHYVVCFDTTAGGCANSSAVPTASFTHLTPLTDGTWYLKVKAVDLLGNESPFSANGSVVINTTPPPPPSPPPPPAPPPPPPPAPASPETPAASTAAGSDQPAAAGTTGAESIAAQTAEIVGKTPVPVALSFPYFLFGALLVLGAVFAWQTKNEVEHINRLTQALREEETLAQEKTNFLQLGMHYLLTPLSVLNVGADALSDSARVPPAAAERISSLTKRLAARLTTVVNEMKGDKYLAKIEAPDVKEATINSYLSPHFLLPIVLIAALAVFANYLFISFGRINLSLINLFTQLAVFLGATQLLYSFFRKRNIKRRTSQDLQQAILHRSLLDKARNNFINKTRKTLEGDLARLKEAVSKLPKDLEVPALEEGIERLERILSRLDLLARVESGRLKRKGRPVDMNKLVGRLVKRSQRQIEAKQVKLALDLDKLKVNQDRGKLAFVIETVLDNALKFTDLGGEIKLVLAKLGSNYQLLVSNSGPPIEKKYLQSLFQPFSRAGSVAKFTHEGIGLSLFLDRVIMRYLGGDIGISSTAKTGTQVTISFPDLAAKPQQPSRAIAPVKNPVHDKIPRLAANFSLVRNWLSKRV